MSTLVSLARSHSNCSTLVNQLADINVVIIVAVSNVIIVVVGGGGI
jgi:hypothetical protein